MGSVTAQLLPTTYVTWEVLGHRRGTNVKISPMLLFPFLFTGFTLWHTATQKRSNSQGIMRRELKVFLCILELSSSLFNFLYKAIVPTSTESNKHSKIFSFNVLDFFLLVYSTTFTCEELNVFEKLGRHPYLKTVKSEVYIPYLYYPKNGITKSDNTIKCKEQYSIN